MSTVMPQSMESQFHAKQLAGGRNRTTQRQMRKLAPKKRRKESAPQQSEASLATTRARQREEISYRAEPEFEDFNNEFRFSLEFAFVLLGYVVGIAALVTFGVDLLIKVPFSRVGVLFDLTNVVAGIGLIYLSWNCHRDLP